MLKFRKGRKLGMTSGESGFSITELIVVLVVLSILLAISIPYLLSYRKLYRSDDQAIKIMDLMREAGQNALTRRRTFRLEIDLTDNALLIIDENGAGASDDREVRRVDLDKVWDVRVDTAPTGITKPIIVAPSTTYANIAFVTDTTGHLRGSTTVTAHNVWQARFRSDGSVTDMNNTTPSPISVNIYVYPPVTGGSTTPRNKFEVRCITLFGGSGAIRFWKWNNSLSTPAFVATQ